MKTQYYLSHFFLLYALFLNVALLSATNYDDDTFTIFSKIMPRFVMMSNQKQNLKDTLEICILHDNIDTATALLLIDKINTNYPNGIKNYTINLRQSSYAEIEKCKDTQLIFMLNSNKTNINDALEFSNKYHVLTMSYDAKLLEDGVQISLFMGRKVLPYINMQAINANKIELDNILLRVSKIYYQKEK